MTDYKAPINWGLKGPYLAALIQTLNAVGALLLVMPLVWQGHHCLATINAGAPVITIILSLLLYRTIPNALNSAGMLAAVVAVVLMTLHAKRNPHPKFLPLHLPMRAFDQPSRLHPARWAVMHGSRPARA